LPVQEESSWYLGSVLQWDRNLLVTLMKRQRFDMTETPNIRLIHTLVRSLGILAMVCAVLAGSAGAEIIKKKKLLPKSVIVGLVASVEEKPVAVEGRKKRPSGEQHETSNIVGAGSQGVATTKTEILAGQNIQPMLAANSASGLVVAEGHYATIVAKGGWPKIAKSGLKKGADGAAVADLNQRLFIEGYLRQEATQGEFAQIFTSATEEALVRFQRNNGLAATGRLDGAAIAALNISAAERLRTIRANIPRLGVYNQNLGSRYVVVNIPAQQIEAVAGTSVYSRHNAIVGRPERPTPVVITAVSKVKFNPYWNAPASIIERDIIPRIQAGGSRVLEDMDITVFRGVGGPEIDPDSVDWDNAVADDFHFRQEPGPKNAMATAKIEFDSPFGIYLHDTPEKQLFRAGRRFFSSGCVRVEQMPTLVSWVLNGQDGYNNPRISNLAETLDRVDVPVSVPPQLRVVYLTAWPVGNVVAFRNDIYDLDQSGFTVGQPMPIGESFEGRRFTLKPIPRLVAASDGDGGFSFFSRASGKTSKGRAKSGSFFDNVDDEESASSRTASIPAKTVILGLSGSGKSLPAKPKSKEKLVVKNSKPKAAPPSVIVGLNGKPGAAKSKASKSEAKTATKSKSNATGAQITKKPVVDCKPDAAGKRPAGCAAKSSPKKPEDKTAAN
jgi:L,D-transpeptidase YcbB